MRSALQRRARCRLQVSPPPSRSFPNSKSLKQLSAIGLSNGVVMCVCLGPR
jgi:hypothetical protein